MSAGFNRKPPPRVRQSEQDSCWAATLESWSRVDSRITAVTEAQMIREYGEGPTGAITPTTKIPVLAKQFGLKANAYNGEDLEDYLEEHLKFSHIFCAYKRDTETAKFHHAVLIYRLSGQRERKIHVSYMDPDGGFHRSRTLDWFAVNGPLVVMRKL